MSINLQSIALRPLLPEDKAFVFEVYISSRGDDLTELGWTTEQIENFLETQYAAHQRFFKADHPKADDLVVMQGDNRIGTMTVARNEQEIRVMDIALLPQYRNAGIGSHLIRELLAEAARLRRPFRLQVMRSNPAVALFERLGIVRIAETGTHYHMEWRADA